MPEIRPLTGDDLVSWFNDQAETAPGSVRQSMDKGLSLSSSLVRAIWRGRHALAVTSVASSAVQIGATLDLLAWHLASARVEGPAADVVTLMLPASASEEIRDAARTLRDAIRSGPTVELLIESAAGPGIGFDLDEQPAPNYAASDRAKSWAPMLEAWRETKPTGVAKGLAELVADERFRLYPMLSAWRDRRWSVRIDGLEVGRVTEVGGSLNVGRDGPTGARSKARSKWVEVWGPKPLPFGQDGAAPVGSVEFAADRVRALIEALADTSGGLDHGQPEHRLESQVLRGALRVEVSGTALDLAFQDDLVSRGSQFPTLWGSGGSVRYLDAILRRGSVPWAVELKVFGGGGSGAYYRHGLAQAVLYRHFIRSAVPVHPWFEKAGLQPTSCEACLALPRASVPSVRERIAALAALGDNFGVPVVELDVAPAAAPASIVDLDDAGDM